MMYEIAWWYLVVAVVNFMIAWLVISLEWKHYLEQINSVPVNNTFVKFIIAMLVPVIYGLGWLFFIPGVLCTAWANYRKK